ncbi:MAG: L,D-transpeptidase family protein [bacterium]
MLKKYQNLVGIVGISLAIVLSGCGEEPIGPTASQTFVQQWKGTVAEKLGEKSEGAPVRKALEARLQAAETREAAATQRDMPPLLTLANAFYAQREYRPVFVSHGKLSPQGKAVWETLQDLEAQVLDARPYNIGEIQKKLDALGEKSTALENSDLSPSDAAVAAMAEWVAKKKPSEFALDEASYEAVTEHLLESAEGEPLKAEMTKLEELGAAVANDSAALEELLAGAFLRYAYEVRYFRARQMFIHPREDDYYNDPEIRASRPDDAKASYLAGKIWRTAAAITDKMYSQPVYARRELSAALERIATAEKPDAVMASLPPQQPQYMKLVEEHKRYQEIVAAGGWKTVSVDKSLKPGMTRASAKDLKVRLAAEGYLAGDPKTFSELYDASLSDAVKAYQKTHQMQVTGSPHTVFWKSLNVPAEKRLEQIRVNIQRWRDTNMRPEEDQTYVFINVADFHAEGWRDQKRVVRHRVVVGNNENVCDPETNECTKANRTPIPIAAYIDRMIFNPYWNVTPRVRKNEILPEVKKSIEEKYAKIREKAQMTPPSLLAAPVESDAPKTDPLAGLPYYNPETGEIDVSTTDPDHIPAWYAANNYEVMYPSKSWEYVRMTPGAHNALGYVKIIFPNLHDVYLHDTNARALFGNDIRAYSHGCMRLDKPLDFASWLLKNDDQEGVVDIDKLLKTGEYLPHFLHRQVPVFVEYYTVRVDDDGRANFLADIYDLDDNPHLPEPTKTGPVDL